MSATLSRFIRLARIGTLDSASSGQRACFALATSILHDASYLDRQSLAGFIEFVEYARSHPTSAADALEGKIDPDTLNA